MSLSRRFSLLRQADGRPVDLQDVRDKFAEQRALGSPNVISEEEEEFVINYLSTAGHIPGGVVDDRGADERGSIGLASNYANSALDSLLSSGPVLHSASQSTFDTPRASQTPPSSLKSRMSNQSYTSKRLSNNLFGSGRLKDQSYFRSVMKKPSSNRSLRSVANRQAGEGSDSKASQSSDKNVNGEAKPQGSHNVIVDEESEEQRLEVVTSVGQAVSTPDERPNSDGDSYNDNSRPITPSNHFIVDDLPPVMPLSPKSPSRTSTANGSTTPLTSPPTSPFVVGRGRTTGSMLFSTAQARRASLALEEVIRNFEQDVEAEEEILTPRTSNGGLAFTNGYTRGGHPRLRSQIVVVPTAVTPNSRDDGDVPMQDEQLSETRRPLGENSPGMKERMSTQHTTGWDRSSSSASKAQSSPQSNSQQPITQISPAARMQGRLPGYVPGMHRPITPKDAESEDLSSTPRALSPSTSSTSKLPLAVQQQAWQGVQSSFRPGGVASSQRRGSASSVTYTSTTALGHTAGSSRAQPPASPTGHPMSTWSSTTTSPTSPTNPSHPSSGLRPKQMSVDDTFRRRDTNVSTSSSSILPASTSSSSSLTSLASPYQSDSVSTPFTSEHNTTAPESTYMSTPIAGDSSYTPYGPTSERKKSIPPSPSSPLRSSHPGAIITTPTSSSIPLVGSSSRPDTPEGQMYTGYGGRHTQRPSISSIGSLASSGNARRPSLDSQKGEVFSHARQHSQPKSHPPISNGFMGQQRQRQQQSDSRCAMSPALPDSPFLRGAGSHDSENPTMSSYSSFSVTLPGDQRPTSKMSQYDLGPTASPMDEKQRTAYAARSPTPSTVGLGNGAGARNRTGSVDLRTPTPGPRSPTPGRAGGQHIRSMSGSTVGQQDNDGDRRLDSISASLAGSTGKRSSSKPKPILVHSAMSSSSSIPVPTSMAPATQASGPIRRDNSLKATALLKSMVDSLQPAPLLSTSFIPSPSSSNGHTPVESQAASPFPTPTKTDEQNEGVPTPARSPVPSFNDPDLRKKALTEALFGDPSSPLTMPQTPTDPTKHPYSNAKDKDLTLEDLEPVSRPTPVPQSPLPTEQLIADVTLRNMAATDALKSPTAARSNSGIRRQGTKKINAKLISTPQLVSSTTTVNTLAHVPETQSTASLTQVTAPSNASVSISEKPSSKLSLRIKKLRERLKTKPSTPNGEEVTPWTYEGRSPSPVSSNHATTPAPLTGGSAVEGPTSGQPPSSAASVDLKNFRFPSPAHPSPSPVASQTGLKGFMSRLRSNSKRETMDHASSMISTEGRPAPPSRSQSQSGHSPMSISQPLPPVSQRAESPLKPLSPLQSISNVSQVVDLSSPSAEVEELRFNLATPPPSGEINQDDVQQLFGLATKIGLDKAALNDLLVRSTSTSSRATTATVITRSNSVNTPATTIAHFSGTRETGRPNTNEGLKRAPSTRTTGALSRVLEQPHPSGAVVTGDGRTIVRRTLIFPSEGSEGSVTRKPSLGKPSRKNRTSTTSIQSVRSLQDRVPTPPPPNKRRQSKDQSPPVPSLPASLTMNGRDASPAGTNPYLLSHRSQKSNSSAYGSLFEMYSEGEAPSVAEPSGPPSPGMPSGEQGQVLEVVELSNGEVIWSVVDAMRSDLALDDEVASLYQSRLSMTSDWSGKSREDGKDNVQVLFREHRRMGSKGSVASSLSRHKVLAANGKRPETKIFFSSAAHIGRLIESMSRGAEAGSFNITPAPDSPLPSDSFSIAKSTISKSTTGTHSPAVSLTDNTIPVEDRLEHLLKIASRGHV
ncbi:hypothetical protein FRB99_002705 [Tulasnella sp. 403]|nr:hypothetical protein FRB99_002705 [Tulasnella sp. 403]